MPWILCFNDFLEAETLKEVSNYCNSGYNIEKAEREEMLATGINLLLKTVHILEKLENFILSDKCIIMIVDLLLKETLITAHVGIKFIDFLAKVGLRITSCKMICRCLVCQNRLFRFHFNK